MFKSSTEKGAGAPANFWQKSEMLCEHSFGIATLQAWVVLSPPSPNSQSRKPKDINGYLKTAKNALKRADKVSGEADYKLIGEIKMLLREIEQQQEALDKSR